MNDNISRQAALDAVSYETFECYQARKDIRALPSADRPKGVWVQKNHFDIDWNVYECDQCGEPWQLEAGTPKDNNMNFCPRCGADMRGVDDESTL